ncbi:(Fe-S)-binding protein [Chloroflexota bacterium]
MPKEKVSLDVTQLDNFIFDMSRCIKCKGCTWVDHIYMPGVTFSTRCPSATRYQFDSYGAYGKMRIGLGMAEGRLEYSDKLLEILYACTLCGACDVGCKRNLDLEIELTLEALRVKAVKDGKGPMPVHKKLAHNIAAQHNYFGSSHQNRTKWLDGAGVKPAAKADVIYFVGCSASYTNPEIAQATAKILDASGTPFMMIADEWCCGNTLFSVGMIDEAKELAQRNIKAVKDSGAATLLVSCAEGLRMWKVDYPKMLNIATTDLGFRVVHLVEFVDELVKKGTLELTKPVDLRLTYHDSCSLSRLSEPWVPWDGKRGLWGVVSPPLERRRGTNGVYQQPRDILESIPGVQLVEMIRKQENAFCCGAGRGVKEAFPDFATWAAEERITEAKTVGAEAIVSSCPWCKNNFSQVLGKNGGGVKVYDISELILAAVKV